jgi:hypothetical protein
MIFSPVCVSVWLGREYKFFFHPHQNKSLDFLLLKYSFLSFSYTDESSFLAGYFYLDFCAFS